MKFSVISVFGIVLVVFSLHLFLNVEAYEREKTAIRENLWSKIKILTRNAHYSTLGKDSLLQCIRGIKSINPETSEIIKNRFRKISGNRGFSLFINEDGGLISSDGLETSELDSIIHAFSTVILAETNYFGLTELIKYKISKKIVRQSMQEMFGNRFVFYNVTENRPGVIACKFRGETGILLMGIVGKSFPDTRGLYFRYSSDEVKAKSFLNASGALALFVPQNVMNEKWFLKSLSTRMKGFPGTLFFGSKKKLITDFCAPVEASFRQKIILELNSKSTGIIEQDGNFFGFGINKNNPQNFVAIFRPAQKNRIFLIVGPVFSSIAFAFFFQPAFFLYFRNAAGGKPSLIIKFFFILTFSIFIPTSGLIFMNFQDEKKMAVFERNLAFSNLEKRICMAEKKYAWETGELTGKIKMMLNYISNPSLLPDDDLLRRALDYFKISFIQKVMMTGKEYKKAEWVGILVAANDDPFHNLLEYLAKNIGIEPSSKGGEKVEIKEAIPELAATIAGREKLYKLFVDHDRFLSFNVYNSTLWSFLHLTPPGKRPSPLFYFFAIDQDKFRTSQTMDLINRSEKSEIPQMIFLKPDDSRFYIFPESASRIPPLRTVVREIIFYGGLQRGIMRLSGKYYYYLARNASGGRMAIMALSPVPAKNMFESLWKHSVAVYPGLVALFVLFLFQKFYLTPLSELRKGVMEIVSGNYNSRLPILSDDEIGHLCLGFNRMTENLAEKDYLSRFLSDLTLSMISKTEKTHAKRIEAVILVSDVRSFTTITEKYGAEEIAELLADYFTEMEEAIDTEGGTIDKFIGDAIVAVFLPALGKSDPAERAVKAAVEMRKRLSELNYRRNAKNKFQINNGIGICRGEVLLGLLGKKDGKRDFTVLGPAVNTAVKLEKLSKYATNSQIIICSRTSSHLPESYKVTRLSESTAHLEGWEIANT
ncbi:MAG: adenylate/guanylate cyclase domain-containing protein [Candidatus Riflebacteria bacterium]|nr:adenylate/guanylate cyclase domain-containing protein [Candidatus Riflebacteria bacterium]